MTLEDLRDRWNELGQGHVFAFFEDLSERQRAAFSTQLEAIDIQRAVSIHQKAIQAEASGVRGKIEPPPPDSAHSLIDGNPNDTNDWRKVGLNAVREGKVAVILMAGGQGTRLGSSAPKGCFDIGMPSRKSLFQLQAERVAAVVKLAGGGSLPWYVMTSGPTRQPTEDFFVEHGYFGLDRKNVIFFEQGVLPAFDNDGKVLLDSKGSVAVAPDGNGGIYNALRAPLKKGEERTVLSDMRERGIEGIHAYCVDNCLVRLADPVFVGYCLSAKADCGNLVVPKHDAKEKTGVTALRDRKWAVVEYSEMPADLAAMPDKDDPSKLAFRASNIANHFFSLSFLESVETFASKMPFHVARKKVPYVDLKTGHRVAPEDVNAVKMEAFVFDVFPFAKRMAILEDQRSECFSPLKNKSGTGVDDPQTSRRDLLAQQRRWIEAAGAHLGNEELELAPCVSLAGEGLESIRGKRATRSGAVGSVTQLAAAFV